MARSSLIELFSRLINPQDRKDKIYVNGEDNNYPERIERVIKNSTTARLSAERFYSFILGFGFEEGNEEMANRNKGLKMYDILDKICDDISYQKGFAVHVNYDIEGKVNYLDVLKFKNVRISEEDDEGYGGYVWYSKKWDGTNLSYNRKKNKNWYYPYNPNLDIINAQRKADGKKDATPEELLKSYRGQVLFVNLDGDSIYPDAWIDPAYNDADTEYHVSVFRNDRIRTGFLGANIVLVPPAEDEKEEVITDEELKQLLGSENAANILKVEVAPEGDKKLADYIHIETIKSEINTEQFQYDEKQVEEHILNCYHIPRILVKNSDSSLFGTSGELLKVAQEIFNQDTEWVRKSIERVFERLFPERDFNIVPIVEMEGKKPEKEEENGFVDN